MLSQQAAQKNEFCFFLVFFKWILEKKLESTSIFRNLIASFVTRFFQNKKQQKNKSRLDFDLFFFGLFFSCFFLDFFSWVRHKLALMMPNCPETKVSSYDVCLYLMQRRARMALCCLDTNACTYASWLSVTHTLPLTRRGALMMPGCPWHEGVLRMTLSCPWHIGLLLWCLSVLDPKVCTYDAWLCVTQALSVTQRFAHMMPGCPWYTGVLLWCLAVIDAKICFYDTNALHDTSADLKRKFPVMAPGCRWHTGTLL